VLKEFKEFIARGNVVDLAVAVVIGAAFTGVVTSFTNDVLMQVLAIFGGKPDFSGYTLTINDAVIRWGSFLTTVVNFLIVGFAMFLVVKAVNKVQNLRAREREEEAATAETEVELLTQIRDALVSRGS
jgi:large conductance mechanosensitive channel